MHSPNQPLNQHPRGFLDPTKVLGMDALLFPAGVIQTGEDILIVPPPPAGVMRRALGIPWAHAFFFNRNGDAMTSVLIVYKKATGEEVVLYDAGALADGSAAVLLQPPTLFLTSVDLGVFLRVTNDVALTNFTGYSFWEDVRAGGRQDTAIEDTNKTIVLDGARDGNARFPLGEMAQLVPVQFFNFDTIPHNFTFFVSDGVSDVELISLVVGAGLANPGTALIDPVALPPGWSLKVKMLEAVATRAPFVLAAYVDTNLSPVRQDQGGAY
jgi:hypothetical protein